ncbi:hypothetical protein LDI01_27220 [Lentilactobacillus diolivorans]|jgi:hypothetical protein|uniref:Uncharacterized protein n=1 Tax=Lentilactobacillus diolivorans TaxID=179838 RepID=A0ABQ0XKV2_9LACO|nr:hypothetical protein LDI01_27220 [Lentilactobacillus diolivorans]
MESEISISNDTPGQIQISRFRIKFTHSSIEFIKHIASITYHTSRRTFILATYLSGDKPIK